MNELTQYLDEEIKLNKKENWSKIDKTIKLKKLSDYALRFCKKHNDDTNCEKLIVFLKLKLNQRRLTTIKEVLYDAEKMIITDIPNLGYENGTFILSRNDKRSSTAKSLTPTKKIDIY